MDQHKSVSLLAPAKVNVGLEVLRQRPDGFHDVNTLYAAIDLCDELELHVRTDGRFTCVVEGNAQLKEEAVEDNLCVRALWSVRELLASTGYDLPGIEVRLRKWIPTGAGLGGGSSDAALTMRGVLEMCEKTVDFAELAEKAAGLGSDVPFFLKGGLALAGSRGQHLSTMQVALPWTLLLVNSGIHIPTPWAYRAINRTDERPATDLVAALHHGVNNPQTLRATLTNDFEEPIFAHYPELERIKEQLYQAGAFFALMSGSGSTMFGLFEKKEQASEAEQSFSEYWTKVTKFCQGGGMKAEG